jgi:hypothetical protein
MLARGIGDTVICGARGIIRARVRESAAIECDRIVRGSLGGSLPKRSRCELISSVLPPPAMALMPPRDRESEIGDNRSGRHYPNISEMDITGFQLFASSSRQFS